MKLEELAQRSIPERFVTSSLVRPESANYVVGQSLTVPVKTGEPLRWAFFAVVAEELEPQEARLSEECQRALDLQPTSRSRPSSQRMCARWSDRLSPWGW